MTGPAEHAFHFPSGDLQFNNRSLPECMLVMTQCIAYCGNDSGVSHLAAAVGCRTIVIFGPSNPHVWAPRGASTSAIVTQPTSCIPCHLIDKKTCDHHCLTDITVDNVLSVFITTIETA
jgi:ADP-heptose:LPS heptosyltransferase